MVVDAYFAKYNFIQAVCQVDLAVVTRLRKDAVLRYAYLGPKRKKRGRPQHYAGQLDPRNPDLTYFRPCIQEKDWVAYEAILQAKALKRWVKVVLLHEFDDAQVLKNYKIFISTDTSMTGIDLFFYYQLRFQIEFLYRDAKQFMGLNHCQSRKKERLHFHFNFVLTLLSLIKIVHWLPKIKEQGKRIPFSVQKLAEEIEMLNLNYERTQINRSLLLPLRSL